MAFCLYLMFRLHEYNAPNRIWVPLHRMSWDWAAYAQDDEYGWEPDIIPNGNDDHNEDNDVYPNPSFDVPEQLPEWNNNSRQLKDDWQPSNPPS